MEPAPLFVQSMLVVTLLFTVGLGVCAVIEGRHAETRGALDSPDRLARNRAAVERASRQREEERPTNWTARDRGLSDRHPQLVRSDTRARPRDASCCQARAISAIAEVLKQ